MSEQQRDTSIGFTVESAVLKAMALTAARKGIRYYLNGVLVTNVDGRLVLASTDGHRLTIFGSDSAQYTGPDFIMPIELVTRAAALLTGEARTVDVSFREGRITVSAFTSEVSDIPIDGTFPDWRLVIPQTISGEIAPGMPVNATYVAAYSRMSKALGVSSAIKIRPNGRGAWLVGIEDQRFVCVLMPMEPTAPHELPAWAKGRPREVDADGVVTTGQGEPQSEAALTA